MITKVCTRCQKTLPCNSIYFHRSKDHKGGYKSICKECVSKHMQQYYIANKTNTNKIKDVYKVNLSRKISYMKRTAKFYYEPRNHDLTVNEFIHLITLHNTCMCCDRCTELVPMLHKKLNQGGSITYYNTLSVCKECRDSYYHRKVLTFDIWYKGYKHFSMNRYSIINNHIKGGF